MDISQLIGFFALVLTTLAFYFKSPRTVLAISAGGAFTWGIHYGTMGALSAMLVASLSGLRDLSGAFHSRRLMQQMLTFYLVIIWGSAYFTFETYVDILPLIGTTLASLSILLRHKPLLFRSVCAGTILLWLTYNSLIGSWAGICCSLMQLSMIFYAMIRYDEIFSRQRNKEHTLPIEQVVPMTTPLD